ALAAITNSAGLPAGAAQAAVPPVCTCPYHPSNIVSTHPNAIAQAQRLFPGHLATCPYVLAWTANPGYFPVAPQIVSKEEVVRLLGQEALGLGGAAFIDGVAAAASAQQQQQQHQAQEQGGDVGHVVATAV